MEELLGGWCPVCRTRCETRSSPAPKACRCTRSRPCGCCSTGACCGEEGAAYAVVGEIASLEVPETLHALIAARLDGLSDAERSLLQDAAVLGKTFSRRVLAAVNGQDESVEPLLVSLVRKEVLSQQSDPRSPEHGQYGFLQDLVRRVAYDTLARRDRKARHLAAAEHLAEGHRRGRDPRSDRRTSRLRVRGRGGRGRRRGIEGAALQRRSHCPPNGPPRWELRARLSGTSSRRRS